MSVQKCGWEAEGGRGLSRASKELGGHKQGSPRPSDLGNHRQMTPS